MGRGAIRHVPQRDFLHDNIVGASAINAAVNCDRAFCVGVYLCIRNLML